MFDIAKAKYRWEDETDMRSLANRAGSSSYVTAFSVLMLCPSCPKVTFSLDW